MTNDIIELRLLAKCFSMNMYKLCDSQIYALAEKTGFQNLSQIKEIVLSLKTHSFNLIKLKNNFVLILKFTKSEALILCPSFDSLNMYLRHFEWLKVVSQSENICKLAYKLYTNKETPSWPLVFNQYAGVKDKIEKSINISSKEMFINEEEVINDLKDINEIALEKALGKITHTSYIGSFFEKNNFIRGEKDVLIGYVSRLNQAAIQTGMPIKEAFIIQDKLMEKIELEARINTLPAWLNELTWIYFYRLKLLRKELTIPIEQRSLRYIENNIKKKITAKEIANYFGYSQQKLSNLFKERYHLTINQFICNKRIEISKKLLTETNYSIVSIASILQFSDSSYYIKEFKKYTNMTPKKFRENHSINIKDKI
ncbi:helix-turn-helix domain-containing protein [Oenococcus oeni]